MNHSNTALQNDTSPENKCKVMKYYDLTETDSKYLSGRNSTNYKKTQKGRFNELRNKINEQKEILPKRLKLEKNQTKILELKNSIMKENIRKQQKWN